MEDKTCSFTGHRSHGLPCGYREDDPRCEALKEKLGIIIKKHIEDYTVQRFLTGMALGVDLIAAEMVLEMKVQYPDITLVGIIPCHTQAVRWGKEQKARYEQLKQQCDEVKILQAEYTPDCMSRRNQYLVEHAQYMVAAWNGKPSGTGSTVNDAFSKKSAGHGDKSLHFANQRRRGSRDFAMKKGWIIAFTLLFFVGLCGCSQKAEVFCASECEQIARCQGKDRCFVNKACLQKIMNPISGDWGQDNIAYLNVHSFDGYTFDVKRYDEKGNPMNEGVTGYSTITIARGQRDEGSCSAIVNPGKGTADGEITLDNQHLELNTENLKKILCSQCWKNFSNQYPEPEGFNAILIDLKTGEMVLLQKTPSTFQLGNYEISSEYRDSTKEFDVELAYLPNI